MARRNQSTQIAAIDIRTQAIKLFLTGLTVAAIAKELDRSEASIYAYISNARLDLIRTKKEHFDQRLALLFDDTFDALATNAHLLADQSFMTTAEPERIDAISRAYGILSDKCFVLLASAGNSRGAQPAAENAESPSGDLDE